MGAFNSEVETYSFQQIFFCEEDVTLVLIDFLECVQNRQPLQLSREGRQKTH